VRGIPVVIVLLVLAVGFLLYQQSRLHDEIVSLRLSTESATRSRPSPPGASGDPRKSLDVIGPPHSAMADPSIPAVQREHDPRAVNPSNPVAAPGADTSVRDQAAYIATVFEHEVEDKAWARSSRQRLQEGLAALSTAPNGLGKIECRSTLCRARYEERDPAACEKVLSGTAHQAPPYSWEGPFMIVRDERAPSEGCGLTLWFAKTGTELPVL